MMNYRFFNYIFFSLMCLQAINSHADIVWLKNGDRFSGRIETMDANSLLIVLGKRTDLVVKWQDVQTIRTTKELWVKVEGSDEEIPTKFREGLPGTVLLDNHNLLRLDEIKSMSRQTDLPKDFDWEGHLDVSSRHVRDIENESDRLKTNFDSRIRSLYWRHIINAQAEYELKNSVKSTDKYDTNYSIDRLLPNDWFWRINADYARDKIADLWLKKKFGTGPGYRFWDNNRGRFEITTLVTRFYYRQLFLPPLEVAWDVDVLAVGWDWKHEVLAATLEFYSTGNYYQPFNSYVAILESGEVIDKIDLKIGKGVEMDWGVRYRLTQSINATAKIEYEYTKSRDFYQNKRIYELGIGFEW